MRLLVLSDLHLEFGNPLSVPDDVNYDVALLAGDINVPGHSAVEWATRRENFDGRPVVYVPGNHEYYGAEFHAELFRMKAAASGSLVHLLAPGTAIIAGVRFIGCTLWTDFELPIGKHRLGKLEQRGRAMAAAKASMADYEWIRVQEGSYGMVLKPSHTLAMHQVDRAWLLEALRIPFDGPTVVVTHHAPSDGSVAEKYADDWCTPAFVSHLPDEFFEVPVLWVHGHTHTRFDYARGNCRVVSDPRGYRRKDMSFENPLFAARFVVEV